MQKEFNTYNSLQLLQKVAQDTQETPNAQPVQQNSQSNTNVNENSVVNQLINQVKNPYFLTPALLGSTIGGVTSKDPLSGALGGAVGAGLGAVAGKTLYDFAARSPYTGKYITQAQNWLDKTVGKGTGDYLPWVPTALMGILGYNLFKSSSYKNPFI